MSYKPQRTISLFAAVVVGISAMVGTGVFVAWNPAYELAGSYLLIALVIAAVVAALNATSNARLARIFPQSGGAYLYGRECINPFIGTLAGWSFLVGKVASASAASLAIGAYLSADNAQYFAVASIALVVLINVLGIRYSIAAMTVLISVVLAVLITVSVAASVQDPATTVNVTNTAHPASNLISVVAAGGILFVAFAGYARIAVLGSEVKKAATTIPIAIAISFSIVVILYFLIAIVLLREPQVLLSETPLAALAQLISYPEVLVAIAAVLAAGSALFALVAGLGRMALVMFSNSGSTSGSTQVRADLVVGVVLIAVTMLGSIAVNLAISAFFILIYYGVVHAASWTQPGSLALRRVVPMVGLVANAMVVGAVVLVALEVPTLAN